MFYFIFLAYCCFFELIYIHWFCNTYYVSFYQSAYQEQTFFFTKYKIILILQIEIFYFLLNLLQVTLLLQLNKYFFAHKLLKNKYPVSDYSYHTRLHKKCPLKLVILRSMQNFFFITENSVKTKLFQTHFTC